jgi:hypothetical protein
MSAISMTLVISIVGVLVLASAFPLAYYSRLLTSKIKRRWESLSAGVAVAYMFVNVLPELAEHQPYVAEAAYGSVLSAEKRIYIWALTGFIAFAGLNEIKLKRSGEETVGQGAGLFYWGKLAGFALYSLLIGYLLTHREDASLLSLCLYVGAMGLHMFMLDVVMAEQFESLYTTRARAALVGCVLLGWVLGSLNALPDAFTSRLFAFVLGGVTITSAHEELRAERAGHFWWFVWGAAAYATILLLI